MTDVQVDGEGVRRLVRMRPSAAFSTAVKMHRWAKRAKGKVAGKVELLYIKLPSPPQWLVNPRRWSFDRWTLLVQWHMRKILNLICVFKISNQIQMFNESSPRYKGFLDRQVKSQIKKFGGLQKLREEQEAELTENFVSPVDQLDPHAKK